MYFPQSLAHGTYANIYGYMMTKEGIIATQIENHGQTWIFLKLSLK